MPGYGGTQRLPRLIGKAAHCNLFFQAKSSTRKKPNRIGLVNEVVPGANLIARVEAFLNQSFPTHPSREVLHRGGKQRIGHEPRGGFLLEASLFAICAGPKTRRKEHLPFLRSVLRSSRDASAGRVRALFEIPGQKRKEGNSCQTKTYSQD